MCSATHKMCSSNKDLCSSNEKMCNLKVFYLVTEGCKKVNSSKNGKFRYEMIGETQPEMGLLEVVAFIYHLFAKSRELNPICNQNLILQLSILDILCSSKFFYKKALPPFNICHFCDMDERSLVKQRTFKRSCSFLLAKYM